MMLFKAYAFSHESVGRDLEGDFLSFVGRYSENNFEVCDFPGCFAPQGRHGFAGLQAQLASDCLAPHLSPPSPHLQHPHRHVVGRFRCW